jgi:dienelactone hydrolase
MLRPVATLILLMTLCRNAVATEQVMVPVDWHGGQVQLTGWFDKPAGAGPFPAVIVLHGCGGYEINVTYTAMPLWVSLLQAQGYATLKLDSLTARGLSEVCSGGLSGRQRAQDVLVAADVLARRPDVARDRIAVIGFSHGGGTAIAAARDWPELRPLRQSLAAHGGKLAASVAFYGGCGNRPDLAPVVLPLLALNGALDDWSLPGPCAALAGEPANHLMTLHVYPGAYHGFDTPSPAPHSNRGHMIAYDGAATADARQRVPAFLAQYLRHGE